MQYAFYAFKCICQTDLSLPEPLAVTTATQSAHHNLPVGVTFACLWEAYKGCCLYSLTHKIPLSIGHVARDISLIHLEIQQPSVKRPRAEFKLALLDVKWKPAYIHVTGAHEDTWDDENKYEKKRGKISVIFILISTAWRMYCLKMPWCFFISAVLKQPTPNWIQLTFSLE